MSTSNRQWMTREGYEKLVQKLHHLREEELTRAQESLAEARSQGDISENAEFEIARNEIWRLEEQIQNISQQLAQAEIVEAQELSGKGIFIGATVVLLNLDTRQKEEITIVNPTEAGNLPNAASAESPFGQALLGKQVGETVEIEVPRGLLRYTIESITYA